MLRQICSGMEALAAEGIVHRDLALRNVLLFGFDADDVDKVVVKVSDFGLSLSIYGGTHKTVAGGPKPIRYMAPESLSKARYSEKSDGETAHPHRSPPPCADDMAELTSHAGGGHNLLCAHTTAVSPLSLLLLLFWDVPPKISVGLWGDRVGAADLRGRPIPLYCG